MEFLKQPKPMSLDRDSDLNWKHFKQNFELYMVATGASEKSDKVKAVYLLNCFGESAVEVFSKFSLE